MYLQLNSISKTFHKTKKETLQDISLEVEKGEFICIVGPSGCGKSTLLNLVTGLDTPTAGTIVLDGQPVTGPGGGRPRGGNVRKSRLHQRDHQDSLCASEKYRGSGICCPPQAGS